MGRHHIKTEYSRNYIIGLNNGILVELNKSLLNPNLVLSAFVYSMTGSAFLVGLLTSVNFLGTFLPQLYVSSLIEHRERKKPFIQFAVAARFFALMLLVFLIWFISRRGEMWTVYLFVACFFIFRLFRGAEFIVFWDFFSRVLPDDKLGGFIAQRSVLSGLVSLLSGLLIIQPVLSSFPDYKSYLILSFIALFVLLLDNIQVALLKEKPDSNPPVKRGLRETTAESAGYLKESSNYRKLLLLRIFHRINMLTFAFLIPYAVEKVGIVGLAGLFLAVIEGSKLLSSLLWGRISNNFGNRIVLALGSVCFFISSVLVVLSASIPEVFAVDIPFLKARMDLPFAVFLLSLVFAGTAQVSNIVSYKAFVLESAPPGRKSSSLAFLNTVTVPMSLIAPVIGASVENNSSGYVLFYMMLAISSLITSFTAFSLKEVRIRK